MKLPLLLLVALPFHAMAQYGGSSYGNSQYQASQRQAQMSMDFQRRTSEKMMSRSRSSNSQLQLVEWKGQREQRVAKQQEAEQKANAAIARLAQRQDSVRLARPAINPTQAAARKKEDAQQLSVLAARNYLDVFLPGQVGAAEEARSLSPQALQSWQTINKELTENSWWSQQDPAQLLEKVTAHRNTLLSLTTELLGFDPATTPKAQGPQSLAPLEAMRAKGPFDLQVATQFMQEAARLEKVAKSPKLVRAVNDFNRLVTEAATKPEYQRDPQKMRNAVKSGLRDVNNEMDRYELEMAQSGVLTYAEVSVSRCAAAYLPKNEKSPKKRDI